MTFSFVRHTQARIKHRTGVRSGGPRSGFRGVQSQRIIVDIGSIRPLLIAIDMDASLYRIARVRWGEQPSGVSTLPFETPGNGAVGFPRKLRGQLQGQIVTDLLKRDFQRIPGARIKHRVKENWLKMVDKVGAVVRVETVINSPRSSKGVACLFRYRDVSMSSTSRHLGALAVVSDPSAKVTRIWQRFTPIG